MPCAIDRDNGPLSGAARLSRGTECHEEYGLYVFFCPELMPRPSFESDFGFLAQRDGVARPGGVPAHTFERKTPPILRLSGGAGQLVAPPGRAGPGAGRLGGSLGGRPGAGRRTRRLSRKSTGSSSSPQGLLEALVLGHVRGVCNRANFGRSSLE